MTPQPHLARVLEGVLEITDDHFARHTADDLVLLRQKKAYRDTLLQFAHLGANHYDEATLLKHVGNFHDDLKTRMTGVENGEDFVVACENHVQHVFNTLFFVHNDEVAAEMALDYFEEFIDGALADMSSPERGNNPLITEEQAQKAHNLLDVCQLYMHSYECLGAEVHRHSGGQTSSLVAYGKAVYEHRAKLAADSVAKGEEGAKEMEPISYDEKGYSEQVSGSAYSEYETMLKDHNMEFGEDITADPMMIYFVERAEEIARRQAVYETKELPKNQRQRKANALAKQHYHEVLKEVVTLLHQGGAEPEAMIAVGEMLEEKLIKVSHVPDNMRDIMGEALQMSKEEALKTVKKHHQKYMADTAPYHAPTSAWIYEKFSVGHRTLERAQKTAIDTLNTLQQNLRDANSLSGLVTETEEFVDDCVHQASFAGMDPVSLLVLEDYLGALQKELGHSFTEHHMFEDNLDSFARLKLVAQKCHAGYEAANAVSDWIQEDSWDPQKQQSGHDSFFIKAYQIYSVSTGVALDKLSQQDFQNIKTISFSLFKDALKYRDVYDASVIHPFTALIYEKSSEMMEKVPMELSDRSKPLSDSMTNLSRDHQALTHTYSILNNIPREDEFGRKTRYAQFTAPVISSVMDYLNNGKTLAEAPQPGYIC